jgi:hypothetical protein
VVGERDRGAGHRSQEADEKGAPLVHPSNVT